MAKNPQSCPRGKKLVKLKNRSFCAGPKRKKGGKRSGKLGGIGSMSTSARKAMTRRTCARPGMTKKMAGLCKWARS